MCARTLFSGQWPARFQWEYTRGTLVSQSEENRTEEVPTPQKWDFEKCTDLSLYNRLARSRYSTLVRFYLYTSSGYILAGFPSSRGKSLYA